MSSLPLVWIGAVAAAGSVDQFEDTLQRLKVESGQDEAEDALPVGQLRVIGQMPGHAGFFVALERSSEAVVQVLILNADWACWTVEEASALVPDVCRAIEREFGHLPAAVVIRKNREPFVSGAPSRSVH